MLPLFYSESYTCSAHSFDTTRKAAWIAESLERDPIEGIEMRYPRSLTFDEIAAVHAPAYVRAVESGEPRSLAESQSFVWDPGLWKMVLASNGGVVEAALAALASKNNAGSLSSGLHHAGRTTGKGFCTFNGLVIAARAALEAGAKSVLILDLDAHCGGGTHSLIEDNVAIWQTDVSVSAFDCYESSDRSSVTMVDSADNYLSTIERQLNHLTKRAPAFGLCIYNAGMDPYEACSTGALVGVTAPILEKREMLVFDWAHRQNIPVAFVLAGGYVGSDLSREELVVLHRFTIEEAE